ncbi:tetratricopeptide repeat protein [Actinoplanes sp. CA-252034]|uniref:tetratricopeptide repeat protein n=1 Tax=Actinoplanes sp. CA-252034 TaxID=3239906 RepID=UPI003D99AF97
MAEQARRMRRAGRCLIYVAAAGYGKSTTLETLCADGAGTYWTAEALLARPYRDPRTAGARVVVDDLCALPGPAQRQLARDLAELPAEVELWLAARRPLDPGFYSALPGTAVERGAADLALSLDQVARVLREEHGIVDAEPAVRVYDVTAGWPALVQFAGEALGRHGVGSEELLAALTEPGTPAASWIGEQVLAEQPEDAAVLMDAAVTLGPLPEALCIGLADAGLLDTGVPAGPLQSLRWLRRAGLLVAGAGGAPRLVPAVSAVLGQRRRAGCAGTGVRSDAFVDFAAGWYSGNGHPLAAAALLHRAGRPAQCAAVLAEHGDRMLAAGGGEQVVRLLRAIPDAERSFAVRLVHGDALRMTGDAAGALRVFAPLLEDPARCGDAGLRWRAAMVHYMRGEYATALELCTPPADAGRTVDDVLLLACRAGALMMLGRSADSAAVAADALRCADGGGDDRAKAAAHIAAALGAVGARRDEHLAAALEAAQRAGDVVTVVRVLVNRAEGLIRDARYPEALRVAARAVATAEHSCPPGLLVAALSNAGDALLRLGRYDEAERHFERVVAVSHRAGLSRAASGLWGIAEVRRQLGRREQSRTAFEEAVEAARAVDDTQVLVPALAGLTRVLLDGPDPDLAAARRAAEEAERAAPRILLPLALVAAGWVAFAEGVLPVAQQRAAAAVTAARASRRADCLANALELVAAVGTDTGGAVAALREAEAIWRAAGALPAADRALVLLGRVPGADGAQRSAAKAAARRLMDLGVPAIDGTRLPASEDGSTPVRMRVLGGFEVFVDGRPVPLPAWRSRQARSLVKILVARRGRPVARLELRELLWPDDEPHRTAHRLSVLLSVVRTVLDPARRWPTDHHVRADLAGISLDPGHVAVDVEELLSDAAHAALLIRTGDRAHAREVLVELDELYRGDAFSDEPYEQWADGLREEARAVWLRALRDLAGLSRAAGDLDQAVTYLVRLLAIDAYDETVHRNLVEVLVRAGRHGEARRAFDRWCQAMRSIDAPVPTARVLAGRA